MHKESSANPLQPVTPSQHKDMYWTKPPDFRFSSSMAVVPLLFSEVVQAVDAMPIAFVKDSKEFNLVGVTGLQPRENLLVSSDGSWIGRYIPEYLRAHPFYSVQNEQNESIVCVDVASGLVYNPEHIPKNNEIELFPFFTSESCLSKELERVVSLLQESVSRQNQTAKICKTLWDYELIKPWEIKIRRSADGRNRDTYEHVEGLFCIEESAMDRLSAAGLAELRDLGGLWLVFCQLLSMRHLKALGKLANERYKSAAVVESILGPHADKGTIDFSNI